MKIEKSEKELIKMYQEGDNESLSIIYTRYWKQFKTVSKRYLCNDSDAEDLIQSLMEKLIRMPIEKRHQQFANINSVSGFFYSVVKNASLDYLRKRKINYVEIDLANTITIDSEDSNITCLEYEKVGLSKSENIYFEEYLSGKKPREISAKFSKSISTTKNTLNNAKRKIIKYYQANNYLLE